jgi:hypothetical protein
VLQGRKILHAASSEGRVGEVPGVWMFRGGARLPKLYGVF